MLKMLPEHFLGWNFHYWGRRLTIWAEIRTSRINCSRRMQRERSGMPQKAMLRDRGFVNLGSRRVGKCPEYFGEFIGKIYLWHNRGWNGVK